VTTKVTTRRAAVPSYYSFKNLDAGEYEGRKRFDPVAATYERAGVCGWEPGEAQGFVINEETQRDVGFGESLRQALAARLANGLHSMMEAAAQMMRGIAVTVVVVLGLSASRSCR
jgi:hypothetical protein